MNPTSKESLYELSVQVLMRKWCEQTENLTLERALLHSKQKSLAELASDVIFKERILELITSELFKRHIDVGTLEFALRARR
jgi:hypothetical protein